MAIQNFDKLNNIANTWYSKMNATKKEKDRRVDLSLLFGEVILLWFDLIIAKKMSREEAEKWLDERLNPIASKEIGKDNIAYINDWSEKEAEKITDVTFKHIEEESEENITENSIEDVKKTTEEADTDNYVFDEFDITIPKSEYWTSDIRGILIGIECASAVSNFRELYVALERGNTRKVWITEADDKVRPTHQAVDHIDIPINDLFQVGNSYLLFPGDVSNGAEEEELANCRCHLETY